jgi:hypothetical protein
MTLDSERQIESLQNELNNKENIIDSLHKQIDTLNYRLEIWDDFPSSSTINALIFVESSNNDSAYNPGEDAVGCLQIRRTMVRDVNRILGKKIYTYNDRWSRTKSIEMLKIYCNHITSTLRSILLDAGMVDQEDWQNHKQLTIGVELKTKWRKIHEFNRRTVTTKLE